MSNVEPIKKERKTPFRPDREGENKITIEAFPRILGELATQIVAQAMNLPKQQFDMRLEAFKAATAYQAMLNRASEGDEGGAILDIRNELVREVPEMKPEGEEQPEEEAEDGGAENA